MLCKYNICLCCVKKCNTLLLNYIDKLLEDKLKFEACTKSMRNDNIEDNKLMLEGKSNVLSVRQYVFEPCLGLDNRKEILVFKGQSGIGKYYLVRKLLKMCADSFKSVNVCPRCFKKNKKYRIPIYVSNKIFKDFLNSKKNINNIIIDIIFKVISEDCDEYDEKETINIKKGIEYYLEQGRFIIYFEKSCVNTNFSEFFKRGKVYSKYNKKACYHNIVLIAVEDGNLDFRMQESYFEMLKVEKLTIDEVKQYISNEEYTRCLSDDIYEILQIPEHLRMFENLGNEAREDMGEKRVTIDNELDFFRFYILARIEEKLKSKGKYERNRNYAIYMSLREYAYDLCTENKKPGIFDTRSKFFSCRDFREARILDKEGEFLFSGCKYFLAADYLYDKFCESQIDDLPSILYEQPQVNSLIYLGRRITDDEIFSRFWKIVKASKKHRVLIWIKILNNSKYSDDAFYLGDFCNYALDKLEDDFYDYSVLESFEKSKSSVINFLKNGYSTITSDDDHIINNRKRRIVYYLGISRKGINQTMIDELMADGTEEHLRYHIIRAIVENYNYDERSTLLINENFQDLSSYCIECQDPIIESDFACLCDKVNTKDRYSYRDKLEIVNKLINLLNNNEYHKRAHAAGALARINGKNSVSYILKLISEELKTIRLKNPGYENCVKVISYGIEAICESYDNESRRDTCLRLSNLLDFNIAFTEQLSDAYATIATGIEYMLDENEKKLPFNLGDRFRNNTLDHIKVLKNMLIRFLEKEDDGLTTRTLQNKLDKLKDLEAVSCSLDLENGENTLVNESFHAIHLADWHIVNENFDDNMIEKDICNYLKGSQLMLITGDPHQYDCGYTESLEILQRMCNKLNLSTEDVFMVPGNHDSGDFEDKQKIIKEIQEKIYDDREYYEIYKNQLYSAFDEYRDFLTGFYGDNNISQGGIHNKVFTWRNKLNIVLINTALLSNGNTDAKQIVDLKELANIEISNKLPVIAIAHHNYHSLYEEHKAALATILNKLKVSAYLCGDVHKIKEDAITLPGGSKIPIYITGKTFGTNADKWSDRAIIWYNFDLNNNKVTLQTLRWDGTELKPTNEFSRRPIDPLDSQEIASFDLL